MRLWLREVLATFNHFIFNNQQYGHSINKNSKEFLLFLQQWLLIVVMVIICASHIRLHHESQTMETLELHWLFRLLVILDLNLKTW